MTCCIRIPPLPLQTGLLFETHESMRATLPYGAFLGHKGNLAKLSPSLNVSRFTTLRGHLGEAVVFPICGGSTFSQAQQDHCGYSIFLPTGSWKVLPAPFHCCPSSSPAVLQDPTQGFAGSPGVCSLSRADACALQLSAIPPWTPPLFPWGCLPLPL